jgi:iron(III) transport system substrate-binding protein
MKLNLSTLACAVLAMAPLITQAQAPEPKASAPMYQGADREAWLLDRARKEGTVTLYTSMAPTEAGPMLKAFEKKYGIKTVLWRGLSDGVVQRVINEGRVKRQGADVIETNGPEMEILSREQVLTEFYSPHTADLPPAMIPKHRQWMPDRLNFFVVAYNTQKIQREEIPKHYEGFLDPKWKGRIGIEATDAEWMAGLVKNMGEARGSAFFDKLAEQKPDVRKGHVLLAQMVASGEVPVGLTIYNANAQSLKQRGAPIDWLPVEPTLARPQGVAVARDAAHPHAATLLADFMISPDGQELLNKMGRPPANVKIKSSLTNFDYVLTDPAQVLDESEKWNKRWNKTFLSK